VTRLADKVAVVTGAQQGIGRAIALELAAQGADVVVNDREATDALRAVAADVEAAGRRSLAVAADVSRPEEAARLIAAAGEAFGTVDLLVNNAGVESIVPMLEISPEEWDRVTHTNLRAQFFCLQAAAKVMIDGGDGGAVVNLGSVQAGMVLPGRTHYAPSKRAVEALTANAAAELAPHGIRVNCIHPGLIDTDMTAWVMEDPEILPVVLDRIALQRPGEPSEIARVAAFLLCEEASYVTGQSLYVDGGFQIL
jgi:NAD(P)-dependent dehydrogenase (short-subunit alcohol dehydrogenase family)